MISYEEALSIIRKTTFEGGEEAVEVLNAGGRVLARDIISSFDLPAFTNSAMDGFAFSWSDDFFRHLESGSGSPSFRIAGESSAGNPFMGDLGENEVIRISTGAKVPGSCDTVIPRELVEESEDSIRIIKRVEKGNAVRVKGSDLGMSELTIRKNTPLQSKHLAMISMFNQTTVSVIKKPRVAILTSGDELRFPGNPLGESAIVNTNGVYLKSALDRLGCEVLDFGISRDDPKEFESKLGEAFDSSDLVVTTAGVSVGDHDVVPQAVESLGAETLFWKLSLRPGKPMLFARQKSSSGSDVPLFAFPGNPVSVFTGVELFLKPWLRAFHGMEFDNEFQPALLAGSAKADMKRLFFALGKRLTKESESKVEVFKRQSSGDFGNTLEADCLVRLEPGSTQVSDETRVSILPLNDGFL